jgi:hypothetical protein
VCWGCSAVIAPTVYYSPPVYYAPSPNSVLHHTIQTIIRPRLLRNPPLKHRARIWIRIVAAHGKVVAIRGLRAIPSRVVARVTVTETITEVVAKKNAAENRIWRDPGIYRIADRSADRSAHLRRHAHNDTRAEHRVAANSDSGLGIARTCKGRGRLRGNDRWHAASIFKRRRPGRRFRLGVVGS